MVSQKMYNFLYQLNLYHTITTFNDLYKKPSENIVGKGENAGYQHFLLFPQCFYPSKNKFKFSVTFILSSTGAFNLDQSKNLSFGKKLRKKCNFWFKLSPNGKILDLTKLKAFAGDKLNVTKNLKYLSDRVENIVGRGENSGYKHFLLVPKYFQKPSFQGLLKVGAVW